MKMILTIQSLCFLLLFTGCNDPGEDAPVAKSILTIGDLSQLRNSFTASTFRFVIDVNPVSAQEIKVNYTTKDGTALSGKDYTMAAGTLTIPAGAFSGYVDVIVTADSLRKDNQTFTLELSSPVNGELARTAATATILNLGTYFPVDNSGYSTPLTYDGMTLVWKDEFTGKTLDPAHWTYETGGGGWGNNELEYYTGNPNNIYLSEGNLVIEAREETRGTYNYTSARIKTQGKKTFTFGRVDIRARLPKGKGLWPALWMLGSNITQPGYGWPACGEIDIMELVGHTPATVHATVHWGISGGAHYYTGDSYSVSQGDFSSAFHVFSFIWEEDKMTFLADDHVYYTATKAEIGSNYPFNLPFFFIFNVAVGGNWPGPPDATTVFPQRMIVDYIRVFQK
jgi:beta-glucanase (GH16 family)